MVIRVNGKEVKSVGFSNNPQAAYKHPIRVGTWHGGSNSHKFNGEIAEIIIWNRSLTQAEMEKEEKRIKNQYECRRTGFKFKAGGELFIKDQKFNLKDGLASGQYSYTIPEIESTIPGCAVWIKAYYKDAPSVLLHEKAVPIGFTDTRIEPRKLLFNVKRSFVQTTKTFFIEAYIPNISQEGMFVKQMSLFVDGKKQPKVIALKPASFTSDLTQIDMLDNGDRVYQMSKFQQEPDIKLPVTYKMADSSPSGVKFDTKKLSLIASSDLTEKADFVEAIIEGEVQNVDADGISVGEPIKAKMTYKLQFAKKIIIPVRKPIAKTEEKAKATDAKANDTKAAAAGSTDAKAVDAKATDAKATDTKDSDAKAVDADGNTVE